MKYAQTVREVKVFGVFLLNSYTETLKRNWDYRYGKFEKAVHSWSSRVLEHLCQRIDVLKIYALSRVFYLASILPLSKTLVKRFEKLMGKFIWNYSGKILRVSFCELKLPLKRGGLGMVCINFMSNSLLLSQLLRLLKHGGDKSVGHASFWLGEVLKELDPEIDKGVHPDVIPPYFQSLACTITDARIAEVLTEKNWKQITNKMAYQSSIITLPDSKIEVEAGMSMSQVWERIAYPSLSAQAKEIVYLLVHNKLPTKERLFHINIAQDPYCERCENNAICDRTHYFCACDSTSDAWNSVTNIIFTILDQSVSDEDLISLKFPKTRNDNEATWLIATYIQYVWTSFQYGRKETIEKGRMFGFLRFKYRSDQLGARHPLNIPNL